MQPNNPVTPNTTKTQIAPTGATTWAVIKRRWYFWLPYLAAVLGVLVFYIVYVIIAGNQSNFLAPTIVLIGLGIVLLRLSLQDKEYIVASSFARLNGYAYSDKLASAPASGVLLAQGEKRTYAGSITGELDGAPLQMLSMNYVVRTEKATINGYAELIITTHTKTLPHVLLIADTGPRQMGWLTPGANMQQLHLEGNFDQRFDTFIEPGNQVEALELLNPEFMQYLLQLPAIVHLEFVGSTVIIMIDGLLVEPKTIMILIEAMRLISPQVDDILRSDHFGTQAPALSAT